MQAKRAERSKCGLKSITARQCGCSYAADHKQSVALCCVCTDCKSLNQEYNDQHNNTGRRKQTNDSRLSQWFVVVGGVAPIEDRNANLAFLESAVWNNSRIYIIVLPAVASLEGIDSLQTIGHKLAIDKWS